MRKLPPAKEFPKIRKPEDVRRWRARLRMPAYQLAQMVGATEWNIFDLEKGRGPLRPDRVALLERALGRYADFLEACEKDVEITPWPYAK